MRFLRRYHNPSTTSYVFQNIWGFFISLQLGFSQHVLQMITFRFTYLQGQLFCNGVTEALLLNSMVSGSDLGLMSKDFTDLSSRRLLRYSNVNQIFIYNYSRFPGSHVLRSKIDLSEFNFLNFFVTDLLFRLILLKFISYHFYRVIWIQQGLCYSSRQLTNG